MEPSEAQKRFDALPEDIKTVIYGADMMAVLQAVGQKYQLHVDQLSLLEAEVSDVMTGYTPPQDFSASMVKGLEIDKPKADLIAKDINDQLFVKIRESLKKLYEPASGSAPAPTATVPVKAIVNPPYTPSAPPEPPKPVPPPAAPVAAPAQPAPVRPLTPSVQTQEALTKPSINASAPTPAAPAAEAVVTPEVPKPAAYKTDPYREPPE